MDILLEGGFYSGHGMAEGNRILLRFLLKAGHRVRIAPRDTNKRDLVLSKSEVEFLRQYEHTKLHKNELYINNGPGWNCRINPDFRINIGRTTFETDRLPESWVKRLNEFTEVWVPCTFNVKTFSKAGVKVPIRVTPNFFDTTRYVPKGNKYKLPFKKSFAFLSVFDLQDNRKGYDILLDGYLNEFSAKDDVVLVIKNRSGKKKDLLQSIIDNHPKPAKEKPRVHMIGKMLPEEDLLALYRACDAFVLPSRGEGWGRPYFEAMLMEMPTIGTNWSGQTDFMNNSNSYLIEVDRMVKITSNPRFPFYKGHYWAEPSLKDLQRKMRYVVEHQKEAKEKGKKARQDLLKRFSMEKVSGIILKEIAKFG